MALIVSTRSAECMLPKALYPILRKVVGHVDQPLVHLTGQFIDLVVHCPMTSCYF